MKNLVKQLEDTFRYLFTHSPRESWAWIGSKEAPFIVQLGKYGLCGVAAVLTHNLIAIQLAKTVFPAMEGSGLTDTQMAYNQIYSNAVALVISNFVAYFLNVLWVFTPGRHSRWKEFGLFTLVNSISGGIGLAAGPVLRPVIGASFLHAQIVIVITSAIVNFLCRKFLIFEK
jgi:putative flippase GtrA